MEGIGTTASSWSRRTARCATATCACWAALGSRATSASWRECGSLGPDAADLDTDQFVSILERRRGGVKATLMNQRGVAGIGNELSDEILWRGRHYPARPFGGVGGGEGREPAGAPPGGPPGAETPRPPTKGAG